MYNYSKKKNIITILKILKKIAIKRLQLTYAGLMVYIFCYMKKTDNFSTIFLAVFLSV